MLVSVILDWGFVLDLNSSVALCRNRKDESRLLGFVFVLSFRCYL